MDLTTAGGGPDLYSYPLATDRVSAGQVSQIAGGTYTFQVAGTLNGATVTLQYQTVGTNGNWSNGPSATSAPSSATFVCPLRANVRVQVSGGSPSNLVAVLLGTGN